ncbi:PstS family phosphate ABC transporter substrate-binding protein [Mucilaginibacter myungsuensis]|uniref:Substrate-binding domain-containing protein n=1 Tax=Mucilaginibacter myungsuensis TaxID=649104 RepID=A0A929KXL3_9SPHI|nr:substrate-binding domain-containing protein [Mucilaginibacter myungsuensis]MBE9662323.1 substrate-binding domain-containing protein [Mucilaginibacter myungsuensis]MDN3599240.1 substrate-binding domain-containing protein [Mucilaginibacter myungsuensis]
MSIKIKFIFFLLAGLSILAAPACKRKKKVPEKNADTFMAGQTDMLIDESCAPIIEEELFVFTSSYTEAKPRLLYKTENELLSLLLTDSIPYAIMTRDLTADERRLMIQHTRPPDANRFAIDAVSLIVNQASADTTITVSEVKAMLNGEFKSDRSVVFDNPNSSLVRYLKDLAGTKELKAKNVYALKNNKEVIRYVATHPNSIGITGFSWLNDPDKDYADDVKKVKIVGVKDNSRKDDIGFTKPSQESLALKTYPFIRSLYIIDCTGRDGLGKGFASFVLSDRGQRIILKSGILPEVMPGREINIVKEQNTERVN